MAAIDTKVLVRLVTRDDPAQYEKARAFIARHQPVLVTQLSVLERVWVLMSRYGMNKTIVCRVASALLDMAELEIERPEHLETALGIWNGSRADFADCYILAAAKAASRTPLATFDGKLVRLEGCLKL